MKIYTSYYSKVARCNTDAVLIKVSNTSPNWFNKELVSLLTDVSPSWELINSYKAGSLSYDEFCKEYREELLRKVSPIDIINELNYIAELYETDTVILLCWEKDANTCHRTELARILSIENNYIGEL